MSRAPLLSARDVRGGYGEISVVEGVSFELAPGGVLGIVGRNGVGKSTLLKLLAGHLPVMRGGIAFRGDLINDLPPHQRHRLGLAFAPQENVAFATLSVADNLTLPHGDRSLRRYDRLFAEFPRIAERLRQKAGDLSGGERKIMSFCRAIGEAAPLTILDEPTEGVQAENIDKMGAAIKARADAGGVFVIVDQNLGLIADIADQVIVMDHGASVFQSEARLSRDALAGRLAL